MLSESLFVENGVGYKVKGRGGGGVSRGDEESGKWEEESVVMNRLVCSFFSSVGAT